MLKNLFDTESSRTQTKRPVFELHHAPLLEQLDVSSQQSAVSSQQSAVSSEQ